MPSLMSARLDTVFLRGAVALVGLGPGHDIGLHADGEVAAIGAFHGAPAPIAVLAVARHVDVDARPRHGFPDRGLFQRVLLHGNDIGHVEHLLGHFVVNEQHDGSPGVNGPLFARGP
jgi:hypothetical protein